MPDPHLLNALKERIGLHPRLEACQLPSSVQSTFRVVGLAQADIRPALELLNCFRNHMLSPALGGLDAIPQECQ